MSQCACSQAGHEAPTAGDVEPRAGLRTARADGSGDDRPGSANSSSKVARGRSTMSAHALAPIITVHPDRARRHGPGPRPRGAGRPASPRPLRGCGAGASRSSLPSPGLCHEVRRHPARGLGLGSPGRHLRGQVVNRGQDRLGGVRERRFVIVSLNGFSSGLVVDGHRWVGGGGVSTQRHFCGGYAGWVPPRRSACREPRPSANCRTRVRARRCGQSARCRHVDLAAAGG